MRNSILSLLLAFFLNILCARGFNNPKKLHIGRPFTLQLKASNFDDFVAAASKTSKSPSLPNRHQSNEKRISYVSSIRSQNLARVNAAKDGNEIVINFGNVDDFNNMMVVVSGESGSGKSLLVSKVAELLTGSKVVPSLLYSTEKPKPTESVASVQMGMFFHLRF
jgi:predicted ATP-dependent serine protease